jgi:hypothetical protein
MSAPSRAARYQQAQQLYVAKRYPEALALLDELALEVPDHPDLLYARTLCLSASGRKDEALRTCDRLIATHGHAKAQHLKARILEREPEPNFIELGPVGATPRPARPRRRLAPLIVLLALLGIGGGLFAYLEFSKGQGANGVSGVDMAPIDGAAQPAGLPTALQGGVPVMLTNMTGAHIDVWVDQVDAQDAPALRVAPEGTQEISLREGSRMVRVRATFDERNRFYSAPHAVMVSGAGTLFFGTRVNEQGITEVTIDFQ